MRDNFSIDISPKGGSLHLELSGNFDGAAAYELLNTIKRYGDGAKRIFINSRNLRKIYPFGLAVLENNLYTVKEQSKKIIFTNENWGEMILQG